MPDRIGEFLAEHDWELLRAVKGWNVERDDKATDVVRLTLPAIDGQRFTVRFVCEGYPEKLPSVKFINAAGSTSDRTAWPSGNDEFHKVVKLPPDSFLCTDLTLEGVQHHPDWMNSPSAWKGSTHTLMNSFNYLHDLLNSADYRCRAK